MGIRRSLFALAALTSLGLGCSAKDPAVLLEAPAPGLDAKPEWLTFTCVEPGCETTRVTSVRVVGARDVAVKRIVVSDRDRTDFEINVEQETPFILKAGETFEIEGTYRPTGDPRLGDVAVIVTYTDASASETEDRIPPGELEVPLVRRLIGEPVLSVDPPLLVFGSVLPSARKTLPLAIQNSGFGNVGVVINTVESDMPDVRIANLPAFAILPANDWDVEVTYSPIDERYTEGTIKVASQDSSSRPALVGVLATSIQRPSIATIPDTGVDFGEVPVGTTGMTTLEIVNQGSEVLELFTVEVLGSGAANITATLPRGAMTATIASLTSIVIDVGLDANTPGFIDAVVRIRSNDRTQRNFEIPVIGLVTEPNAQVSPGLLDFGIVPRGWTLKQRVELENVGYGSLDIASIGMVLGSSDLFTLQQLPQLPASLQHQERVSFEVEFRSEAQAQFNGTIAIETNDPDTPFVEVSVTAQGASCETGCPIENGTPSCLGGECGIGMCDPGWYDTDGSAATGCECAEIGRDPGAFCSDGHWAGVLEDGDGDSATFTGVLAKEGDIDIITFFAVDESQVFGDDFDVRIRLESADPSIEMCVYRHDTGQHENACFYENEQCGRSVRRDGSYGRGDDADFIIKISRRSGAAPTCTSYTVFMRNG